MSTDKVSIQGGYLSGPTALPASFSGIIMISYENSVHTAIKPLKLAGSAVGPLRLPPCIRLPLVNTRVFTPHAIDRGVHLMLSRGKRHPFSLYHATHVIDKLLSNFNTELVKEDLLFLG